MADIVVLASSLHRVVEQGGRFVFTDRHAYLRTAVFSSRLEDLTRLDWANLRGRDFRRAEEDPGRIERYQAEALIHRFLPVAALSGLGCYGLEQQRKLEQDVARRGLGLKVLTRREWYF